MGWRCTAPASPTRYAALVAPFVYTHSAFALVGKPFQPPFGDYLFGTDQLGRDVTAEVLLGARTTLAIGLFATAIAVLVGMTIGGLAERLPQ